jgi:hypothetical protein
MKNILLNQKNPFFFQLVIGMIRIHSTLHVFSKIGLVMLFFRSVLVRDGFFFSKFACFFIVKYIYIYRSPCVHWTKVCEFLFPFQFTTFIHFFLFIYILGSPKLQAQLYYPCLFLNTKSRLKKSRNLRARRLKKGNQGFYLLVGA